MKRTPRTAAIEAGAAVVGAQQTSPPRSAGTRAEPVPTAAQILAGVARVLAAGDPAVWQRLLDPAH